MTLFTAHPEEALHFHNLILGRILRLHPRHPRHNRHWRTAVSVRKYDRFNSIPADLEYLNFNSLEAVSRCRDPQIQVGENYSYLCKLGRKKDKY